jgi:hypothetical protein
LPIGLDAYRHWDAWPLQRIGCRAYMRSTYDRRGGNEGADASHFLYQLADDRNVTLDVANAGILYFARYNHWHGSPWHYEIDAADHVLSESSTPDPIHPKANSIFLPADVLPEPLTYTWSKTKGADLMWAPMGFEKSFRMSYERTRYGTGYYIYHQFCPGTPISRPIRAWDGTTPPDADVLELINRSGTDIAPSAGPTVEERSGQVDLSAKGTAGPLDVDGPGVIRAIQLSAPKDRALDLANVRLRVTWDGRAQPSIDAPLPLFFGAGTLYNRDAKEYLVKSFPMTIRFDAERVYLACYFPMPFFRSASFELVNDGDTEIANLAYSLRGTAFDGAPANVGYFHATYRDFPTPERGKDLVLLNTVGIEGAETWSGSFVGTTYTFTHTANLTTLEGDPRFFFDDSQTPQAQGTGSEEWGGGGDYWGGRTMTLPFAGHPVGVPKAADAKLEIDKLHSAYRFLLADLFPFGRNARIQLEHGGTNESKEHYQTVTYWYGLPAASLVRTDALKVADEASERAHGYASPDAGAPYELTSRYEWGVDHLGKDEIYPAQTDHGRITTGTSEFTLKLDPANMGVMLRRKLDYQYPNQRAEVLVADSSDATRAPTDPNFKPAGTWYTAGSNTCVYSNPKGELDPAVHTVQTSNRRFRDDEFLLPVDLTRGRSAIRVRVKLLPTHVPLFPGRPLDTEAWSEFEYAAYCYVTPNFRP